MLLMAIIFIYHNHQQPPMQILNKHLKINKEIPQKKKKN